ncbi:hypothetical protein C7974DRAFT_468405 [Boeremia exigua]|uniref:uncharacterized protein n=1 Tax=Boeremia exigua TaxID=749465 RepID=UPI001E8DC4CE|nr:uncharacterized protein C7974DRAFT_468405 [Boeremia exigua]KAH6644890.1 hypothetical protein C7974DRAFT_468405 [Boeremia exigua]
MQRPTWRGAPDVSLIDHQIAHPDCDAAQLQEALERGFGPNTWWQKALIEESDPDLERSSRFPGHISWRNVNTPLHRFSSARKLDAVRVLLKYGAQIELRNAMGRTALHEAVLWDRSEVVMLLAENGADANTVSEPASFEAYETSRLWFAGRLPLYEAIYNSNLEIIVTLITAGADFHHTSESGWTIFDLAILHRDRSIITLLLKHGAQTSQCAPTRFPSDKCKTAYSHVVNQPEFITACEDLSVYQHPLDVFLELLSQAAEWPNPESFQAAPVCVGCAKALEQASPEKQGPFEVHPNMRSLAQTKDECSLCAIFGDAFEVGSNASALLRTDGDDDDEAEDSRPVSVTVVIGKFGRHLTVSCGIHEKKLDLYPMSDVDSALPTRIINVGDTLNPPFLHQSNGECAPYVALSYCWGSSGNFRTTKESLLNNSKEIPLQALPATLRDAVIVTRELGVRYLWIDAICIVQDDAEDWNREAAQMQSVYLNAAVTLSAMASDDASGGLFRSRGPRFVSPVHLPLHFPPRDRPSWGQRPPKLYWFVLPAQASINQFKPGPVSSRARTLQEQHLNQRIIHFDPEMMFWECLSSHGSELDPEGQNHAHSSVPGGTRKQKRLLQGCPYARDLEIYGRDTDSEHAKATAVKDRLSGYLYEQWQDLVSEYSSRSLTNLTDKIPAFLGLSRTLEARLQDEFIAGIWKENFWCTVKPGVASRNPHYPSWTWVSVDGKVQYRCKSLKGISWEPSKMAMDIHTSGPSQNRVTGNVRLKSTLRRFPAHFRFGLYRSLNGYELASHALNLLYSRTDDDATKRVAKSFFDLSDHNAKEQKEDKRLVEEGFRDVRSSFQESEDSANDWEGAGTDIHCVVIARIPKGPPVSTGKGARCYAGHPFPHGRPASVICICLTRVGDGQPEAGLTGDVYRRIGLCEFWDRLRFWDGAMKDEWVTII